MAILVIDNVDAELLHRQYRTLVAIHKTFSTLTFAPDMPSTLGELAGVIEFFEEIMIQNPNEFPMSEGDPL